MRIAILADPIDNQNAGIHVFTRDMVNAMINCKGSHEIILIREKIDHSLSGVKQVALWNTRLPIGYASLRLFLMIPIVCHYLKVDVVIEPAHFGPFNLKDKIKRVTVIHDLTPIIFPELHRWHSQLLQKIFLKRILNRTDLIIANSENTKSDICKTYSENCSKVTRIYPGKGTAFLPTLNPDVLLKYKIHNPYFLFVGTIEPRKNLTTLLKAFDVFKQKHGGNTSLVIAGGRGWKTESFDEQLNRTTFKSDIICTGFIDDEDLPALYSQCIAMIYPSLYEGFGLPVVEAMGCGVPVILADNSSLTEAGGKGALYFNTINFNHLAEKMSDIVFNTQLRSDLAETGKEHAAKFQWNLFAENIWKKLEELKHS